MHNLLGRYHSEINQQTFAIAGPENVSHLGSTEQLFIWSNNLSSFPPPLLVSFRSHRLVLGGHKIVKGFVRKIFVRRVISKAVFAVIVVVG